MPVPSASTFVSPSASTMANTSPVSAKDSPVRSLRAIIAPSRCVWKVHWTESAWLLSRRAPPLESATAWPGKGPGYSTTACAEFALGLRKTHPSEAHLVKSFLMMPYLEGLLSLS